MISPAPPFPRQQLKSISTLVVNVVLARRRRQFHWLYLPEKEFSFYRVGYYPRGRVVSVYLEKTVAAAGTVDEASVLREVTRTLLRTGMVSRPQEILFHDLKRIPVSYIVFDRNWPQLVPQILSYLRRLGILVLGLVIFVMVASIPVFGWVASILAISFGLGGIWQAYRERRADLKWAAETAAKLKAKDAESATVPAEVAVEVTPVAKTEPKPATNGKATTAVPAPAKKPAAPKTKKP